MEKYEGGGKLCALAWTGLMVLLIGGLIGCLMPEEVLAHPGRTDANGGHTCRTNCEKWGLEYGEYHYHSGGTGSGSSGNTGGAGMSNGQSQSSQQSKNVSQPVIKKNNDTSLKLVEVDGEELIVANEMSYTTFAEKIQVVAEPNDVKAMVEVKNKDLVVGDNKIEIEVTAEDGTKKTYSLQVKREKLSDNVNIKVVVDGRGVEFADGAAQLEVEANRKKLDYEYELEDKNARVEIDDVDELKTGDNVFEFVVTAQDGTRQTYILTVHKDATVGETVGGFVVVGAVGCAVYGAYNSHAKKAKKKAD